MLSLLSHLAIVSNAPMSMIIQIPLPYPTFNLYRYIPRNVTVGSHANLNFLNIFEEWLYCFPQCLCDFTFLQTVQKWFNFSIYSPTFVKYLFLDPISFLELFVSFDLILLLLKCLLLASMTPHNINCLIDITYLCLFCSWSLNVSIPLMSNYNS